MALFIERASLEPTYLMLIPGHVRLVLIPSLTSKSIVGSKIQDPMILILLLVHSQSKLIDNEVRYTPVLAIQQRPDDRMPEAYTTS